MIHVPPSYVQQIFKEALAMGTYKSYTACKYIIEQEVEKAEAGTSTLPIKLNRYEVEVWDNQTDINGVPASEMIKEVPPGGYAFLIKVNGALSIFQPHDPQQAGFAPMNVTTATERGAEMAAQMTAENILSQLRSYLIEICILD